MGSLSRDTQLYVGQLLLLGQGAEEPDLLFAWGLPLVVRFEGRLEVRLDVYVERLRFDGVVGRVVDTRYSASGREMMQVACQLRELGSSVVLLALVLVLHGSSEVVVQLLADFFVLGLDVHQVILSGVEVMLVLTRVVTAVTDTKKEPPQSSHVRETQNFYLLFLHDLSLLVEELQLVVVALSLNASHVFLAALKAAITALD